MPCTLPLLLENIQEQTDLQNVRTRKDPSDHTIHSFPFPDFSFNPQDRLRIVYVNSVCKILSFCD